MAKPQKQDTAPQTPADAPPPPDPAAAYDALLKLNTALQAELDALKSKSPKDLEPLRRENADLRESLTVAKAQAERSKNAAALAQQELAAAKQALPQHAHVATTNTGVPARTFLYCKGDPKLPASPKVRARAFTQALAEDQPEVKAALADGFQFRGCI